MLFLRQFLAITAPKCIIYQIKLHFRLCLVLRILWKTQENIFLSSTCSWNVSTFLREYCKIKRKETWKRCITDFFDVSFYRLFFLCRFIVKPFYVCYTNKIRHFVFSFWQNKHMMDVMFHFTVSLLNFHFLYLVALMMERMFNLCKLMKIIYIGCTEQFKINNEINQKSISLYTTQSIFFTIF